MGSSNETCYLSFANEAPDAFYVFWAIDFDALMLQLPGYTGLKCHVPCLVAVEGYIFVPVLTRGTTTCHPGRCSQGGGSFWVFFGFFLGYFFGLMLGR